MTQLQQVYHIDQMLCNYRKVHTLFITFPESGLHHACVCGSPKRPIWIEGKPKCLDQTTHTPTDTHEQKKAKEKSHF